MKSKIYISFFFFLFINISAFSQGWMKVWSDEFDTDGLPDSKKWNYETGCSLYNNEVENYTAKDTNNARVRNGNLIIEARKGKSGSCNYSSARLTTQFKGDWLYGRMEVRAKLPTGNGMWPAIWMMPSDNYYGSWPASGEIDIMENVGRDPDRILHTIHTTSANNGTNELVDQPYNVYHVYALEWDSIHMDFFVDSVKKFTYNKANRNSSYWPFNKRFFLILNIAVGGTLGGTVDNTIFPQRMYVDYVRVYEWQNYPGPYTITATADTTEGSVVLDPQDSLYPSGTPLKITAIPKKDFRFVNWVVTENGISNTLINPLNFNVNRDYHIKANFLPICEQVSNGDFSSDKNYWSLITNDGSTATADVLNGELKVQISNKGQYNYSVQILQTNVKIVKGDNYKLSFDAYTTTSRNIDVFAGLNVSPWTNYFFRTVALTSQKQTFSFNFLMNYTTDTLARVGFNLSQSLPDIYIDNVSLCDLTSVNAVNSIFQNNKLSFNVYSIESDKMLHVNYSLPTDEKIEITLYDITGKIIQTIEQGNKTAGEHNSIFYYGKINNVSGIYIVKLSSIHGNQFQKILLF